MSTYKIRKAITAICGLIGFLGGYTLGTMDIWYISIAGAFIMIWGIYLFIKGTYPHPDERFQ